MDAANRSLSIVVQPDRHQSARSAPPGLRGPTTASAV